MRHLWPNQNLILIRRCRFLILVSDFWSDLIRLSDSILREPFLTTCEQFSWGVNNFRRNGSFVGFNPKANLEFEICTLDDNSPTAVQAPQEEGVIDMSALRRVTRDEMNAFLQRTVTSWRWEISAGSDLQRRRSGSSSNLVQVTITVSMWPAKFKSMWCSRTLDVMRSPRRRSSLVGLVTHNMDICI